MIKYLNCNVNLGKIEACAIDKLGPIRIPCIVYCRACARCAALRFMMSMPSTGGARLSEQLAWNCSKVRKGVK